ncbi:hypothetical protein ZWY2020_050588 [Hordeum vulgare]|nr:hypothetical protein ZWY2020_050588 [Hordeum vulgare]
MSQQAYYDPPDNQVQDKHADENQHLEDDQVLLNQGIGMHDLDKNYQNSEQMLVNQRANEHGHGDQQPESEQMLLNNEEAMLKQDAEEQVENEQLLPHLATDLNFFKRFLGRGFLKHVQDNGLLQDIFNIKADKAETLSSNDKKIFRSGEEKGRALKLNKDRRLAQERKNAALFDE